MLNVPNGEERGEDVCIRRLAEVVFRTTYRGRVTAYFCNFTDDETVNENEEK